MSSFCRQWVIAAIVSMLLFQVWTALDALTIWVKEKKSRNMQWLPVRESERTDPERKQTHKTTQFTERIKWVIGNLSAIHNVTTASCHIELLFSVQQPYSVPDIECLSHRPGSSVHRYPDCWLMKRLFQNKTLPYNVSVGFEHGDFHENPLKKPCFVNSAPDGLLGVPSTLDRYTMKYGEMFGYPYRWKQPPRDAVPWDQRETKPVFRGTAYHGAYCTANTTADSYASHVKKYYEVRYNAVLYSLRNPDKLDARLTGEAIGVRPPEVEEYCNQTKERDPEFRQMLTWKKIPQNEYYSKYQVALVVRGLGPAHRVIRHLCAGQAVIMQYCHLKDWYIPLLKPYVHYIPLAEDLSNMTEVLDWVRDHPAKVKQIADNGFAFHEKYLTFNKTEEHFYELIWRISEHKHFQDSQAEQASPLDITPFE